MYTHLSNVHIFVYFTAKGWFFSTKTHYKMIVWEVDSNKDDSTCILHNKINTDKCCTIYYLRLNFTATSIDTIFKFPSHA